jgi:hypothetical protein
MHVTLRKACGLTYTVLWTSIGDDVQTTPVADIRIDRTAIQRVTRQSSFK